MSKLQIYKMGAAPSTRITRPSWCTEWKELADLTEPVPEAELRETCAEAGRLFDSCKYSAAAEKCMSVIIELRAHVNDASLTIFTMAALSYAYSGRADRGIDLLTRLIDILAMNGEMDSIRVARLWAKLAEVHGEHMQPHRTVMLMTLVAIPMLHRNGASMQEILKSQLHVANIYGAHGQRQKQLDLLQQILDQQAFPDDHIEMTRIKANMAVAYGQLGRHEEGIELLLKILEQKEALLGKEHVELGRTLHNLAIAYGNFGNHHKKLEYISRALAIKEAHYEPTSHEIFLTLGIKCNALRDLVPIVEEDMRPKYINEYIAALNKIIALIAESPLGSRSEYRRALDRSVTELAAANAKLRS